MKKSTLKDKKQKELIHSLVCYSISLLLATAEYKKVLDSRDKRTSINKKIADIFKTSNFRKELVNVVTFQITKRAQLPHYVVIFGQDFDLCVKYSRSSLMQICISGSYNLTLFEIPYIQINTVGDKVRAADINPEVDVPTVELIDSYALHEEIGQEFK